MQRDKVEREKVHERRKDIRNSKEDWALAKVGRRNNFIWLF